MPAVPLRADFDAVAVRRAARVAKDPDQARRLLAIAAVYDGMSRSEAATVGGMDRQTLRDWVHRFNDQGAGGPGGPQVSRGRTAVEPGAADGAG